MAPPIVLAEGDDLADVQDVAWGRDAVLRGVGVSPGLNVGSW